MTLDEFMTALEKTPRHWRLKARGEIRCNTDRVTAFGEQEACPWTYLSTPGFDSDPGYYMPQRIFKAADNEKDHDPELRKRLLAACGLTESK